MFGALMRFIQAKKFLPVLSETEKVAMEAGTVWMDKELFSGNPDFKKMLSDSSYPGLSKEEQDFMDNEVEELFKMVEEVQWDMKRTRKVPKYILDFLAENGFYAMNTPKPWGLGFSALGKSAVMTKLASMPILVGTQIVIPNSLGAAELIGRYGTDDQKEHYLRKLANGDYIPCFGLTEPTAGSDAGSIKADGIVFKGDDGELKIKLNFRKRYITNAPISNLVSLAFVMKDPENLLGKGEDIGITVVLLKKGMQGLHIGDHHDPMNTAFANGPIVGTDVIANVSDIIGGAEYAGQGWRMLMECLSGGRAISLPASGVGAVRNTAGVLGAYSMVRQQFGISIGHMEGIQLPVARTAAMAYAMDAARIYTCGAINEGHRPSVLSAIMKAYTTEQGRVAVCDGMDVMSGAAVMYGPNNVIQDGYTGIPISITVEGANIMTTNLIIFGQGATRCHPYSLDMVNAVEASDVASFRKSLIGWVGHMFMTRVRLMARSATRGWSAMFKSNMGGPLAKYKRRIAWSSARFALLTDRAMIMMGGKLKVRGNLTARYADAISWMYIATATIRRFEAEGQIKEDQAVAEWALDHAMCEMQVAFEEIYENFDAPLIGWWMRNIQLPFLRLNKLGSRPTHKANAIVAKSIQQLGPQYDRICQENYRPQKTSEHAGRLMNAFALVCEAQPLLDRLIAAVRAKKVEKLRGAALVEAGVKNGIITTEEAEVIAKAEAARLEAIEVDHFTKEEYYPIVNDAPEWANDKQDAADAA